MKKMTYILTFAAIISATNANAFIDIDAHKDLAKKQAAESIITDKSKETIVNEHKDLATQEAQESTSNAIMGNENTQNAKDAINKANTIKSLFE